MSEEIKNPSVFKIDEISDEELNSLYDNVVTDFDEGELVTGTVVKIESDEILLDIGFKSEGVIPVKELTIRANVAVEEVVKIGDEIEALVYQKEDKDGRLILSRKRAEYERAWIDIEEKFNAGEIVEGEVIEIVKGGLILDIGLRGFLPASLVDIHRIKDLDSYLGSTVEARIIELDRNRNNVVLSRRILLEEERKSERAEILGKLAKGMRLKGVVSSIVDFGTFVDLGGIDGLVYISELSWNHVNHPSEVVKVGQEVEVEVLEVDTNRERISLGLKQTQEDPWATMAQQYPIDSIIDGKVTKLVPFGIFVELADGIEGLVHISEMAAKHVTTPSQVVKVGDEIQVKVMAIDLERRRISLSMRAAADDLGISIEVTELDPEKEKAVEPADDSEAEFAEAIAPAADDVVAEDVVAEEAPVEEPVAEEVAAPTEELPAEEAPVEEAATAEEAPVEEVVAPTEDEAPAEEPAPVEEATPVEDAAEEGKEDEGEETLSVEEPAAVEAPVEEVVEEVAAPSEELPAEEAPVEEAATAEEVPAEEAVGENPSVEEN